MVRHKISEKAANAFLNNKKFTKENTKVEIYTSETKLLLFHNVIAKKDKNGNIFICFQGYKTATTVDRLEAVTDLQFSIAKNMLRYRQYSNNNWIEISSFEWYKLIEKDGKKWLDLLE